ncbi:hypothetical protein GCM10011496_14380 [Polaromonas eurypsychrophila]|uniref:Uncharacterized protein n=1 Tax=Polaromonas eurypsychrophila TaxID=1614635 RepID=A0A916WFH0_9BURK|nr:hypothetical protein GCM10011496_14380 [Polaromonas eurypsychrophila]
MQWFACEVTPAPGKYVARRTGEGLSKKDRLKVGRLYGRRFATRREAMDEGMDWLNL